MAMASALYSSLSKKESRALIRRSYRYAIFKHLEAGSMLFQAIYSVVSCRKKRSLTPVHYDLFFTQSYSVLG